MPYAPILIGDWGILICVVLTILYFLVPQSKYTLSFVIPIIIVFVSYLIYAIGENHKWMHNKVMDFLSNISMEIYLCHMVWFRAVETMPNTFYAGGQQDGTE